jgi:hypothetical protein
VKNPLTRLFAGLFVYFAVSLCLCLGLPAAWAADPNADIYGTWRITRDVSPEGSISGRNQRQIDKMIGKTAVISAERFALNNRTCSRPRYARSTDDTATYFYREWRVNSDEMPLGERVTIIEVGCDDTDLIYPVDQNRLIIADDGDFFEAVRVGVEAASKLSPGPTQTESDRVNADIFGTWTINGVNWERATAQSKKKGNIFIGMPVYISASRFFYNENTCKQPTYKRSKQNKASHFHGDWRADPARLPLPEMVTIIETECGTIYPVSKHRILIEDKSGTFFSAVPLSGESPG